MKKIVLTLALAIFAFAANAQLVISANIGGAMTSGTTFSQTKVTGGLEYTRSNDIAMPKSTTLTGGIKIGYQFGKCQAGVAGSFTQVSGENLPLDPTIVPIIQNVVEGMITTGSMTSKASSFCVAPYFRYDIIKAGDVSLFAELNLLYAKSMSPTCTAHVHDSSILMPFIHDTVGTFPHPMDVTTMGASIVPGLSWQLSTHCGIDLYLDFLAFAYSQATTVRTDFDWSFRFVGTTLISEYTEVTTTTKEQNFGASITGTPLLTNVGANNWVRVGFNFTF